MGRGRVEEGEGEGKRRGAWGGKEWMRGKVEERKSRGGGDGRIMQ